MQITSIRAEHTAATIQSEFSNRFVQYIFCRIQVLYYHFHSMFDSIFDFLVGGRYILALVSFFLHKCPAALVSICFRTSPGCPKNCLISQVQICRNFSSDLDLVSSFPGYPKVRFVAQLQNWSRVPHA